MGVRVSIGKDGVKRKRNIYIDLKPEESIFVKGDRIQEANSDQTEEFVFRSIKEDRGGQYIECESSNGTLRYFFLDSVKKSAKQIQEEKRERKRLKKLKKEIEKKSNANNKVQSRKRKVI